MVRRRFPAPKPKHTKDAAIEPKEKPLKVITGDPAGDDSYQSMKNRLWNIYQGKYYPAFMKFRNEVTMHILEIGRSGEKNKAKSLKGIAAAREEYIKIAMDAFSEYLHALTISYINDKAYNQGVDLKTSAKDVQDAVKGPKARPANKVILTSAEAKQEAKKLKAAKQRGKKV
jgi:hypothetical protein